MTTPKNSPMKFAVTLADGETLNIKSPPLPDFGEFCLSGNHRVFADFIAFHDPVHDVGATYRISTAGWTLNGPVNAADFWQACAIMSRAQDALVALAGAAGESESRARHWPRK